VLFESHIFFRHLYTLNKEKVLIALTSLKSVSLLFENVCELSGMSCSDLLLYAF